MTCESDVWLVVNLQNAPVPFLKNSAWEYHTGGDYRINFLNSINSGLKAKVHSKWTGFARLEPPSGSSFLYTPPPVKPGTIQGQNANETFNVANRDDGRCASSSVFANAKAA
jgi:hypothetical protein